MTKDKKFKKVVRAYVVEKGFFYQAAHNELSKDREAYAASRARLDQPLGDDHLSPVELRAAVFQDWRDREQKEDVLDHLSDCGICKKRVDDDRAASRG